MLIATLAALELLAIHGQHEICSMVPILWLVFPIRGICSSVTSPACLLLGVASVHMGKSLDYRQLLVTKSLSKSVEQTSPIPFLSHISDALHAFREAYFIRPIAQCRSK